MKVNLNKYIQILIYVTVPLFLGGVVGIINRSNFDDYTGIVPGFVFPIVWSILYVLMGISSYLVRYNNRLICIYIVNLVFNFFWTFIFFMFNLKVIAFFWILLLILIVGIMIYEFYKENKISAYLLIPYFLWLCFASVLNLLQII